MPSFTIHRLRRTQNAGHLQWGIKPFLIDYQPGAMAPTFAFEAKTTLSNAFKVLRAMQLKKSILLEGSPGVGKTGLIDALAKATGVILLSLLSTLISSPQHTSCLNPQDHTLSQLVETALQRSLGSGVWNFNWKWHKFFINVVEVACHVTCKWHKIMKSCTRACAMIMFLDLTHLHAIIIVIPLTLSSLE